MILISPSLLSADFAVLKQELDELKQSGADWIHLDIMDGHFVPNITFGPDQVKYISKYTDIPLDIHLMIEFPEDYIEKFAKSDPYIITIHHESKGNIVRCLKKIKSLGIKAGISIKPDTNTSVIEQYLDYIDMVLVMSVYPGFGGQCYIENSTSRIKEVKTKIKTKDNIYLQVDGGINENTAKSVIDAGADVLVSGSYIFKGEKAENIRNLKLLSTIRLK